MLAVRVVWRRVGVERQGCGQRLGRLFTGGSIWKAKLRKAFETSHLRSVLSVVEVSWEVRFRDSSVLAVFISLNITISMWIWCIEWLLLHDVLAVKPGIHWRQSRMSKRLSTKINTIPATNQRQSWLSPIRSNLSPVLATVDYRQNGNNLNIYESRDDPVTSDVISIQWKPFDFSISFDNYSCICCKQTSPTKYAVSKLTVTKRSVFINIHEVSTLSPVCTGL